MKKSNRTSAIYFVPVKPCPCETIPGGTVCEEVCVPWLAEPLGKIVSRLSDQPPDELSRGRVRTYWYFLPGDPASATLQSDTSVHDVHLRVQLHYRGVYDLKNARLGRVIASGDDCEIEDKVLEWSGMCEIWNDAELSRGSSFYRDVLMSCPSATLRSAEWDGNTPGRSGVWFTVRSRNPDALRQEIAAGIQVLIIEKQIKKPTPRV